LDPPEPAMVSQRLSIVKEKLQTEEEKDD
jgi:hypothetical protein